jgi:RNA polymerase sigma-70 factor, ECF subfamily
VDDATLLDLVAAGDKPAMKVLYERHSAALFHFLRGRLNDGFEASDVLQETFLEVWRSAARFERRSAARTWIFGIARNKAADRIRRGRRTVVAEPDVTVPDEAPNPEAVAAMAGEGAKVRACMQELSETHRSAVHLAFFEDMPYGEIAVVEGVPVGTVKTRVHHAKQLLRRCLERVARRG